MAGVESMTDEAAVPGEDGAALPQRRIDRGGKFVTGIQSVSQRCEQAGAGPENCDQIGQGGEAAANPFQIPRTGPA